MSKSTTPNDKDNVSKRKQVMQIVVIGILVILGLLTVPYIFSALYHEGTRQTMTIMDDVVDTPAGHYSYYTFRIPTGASDRLVHLTLE